MQGQGAVTKPPKEKREGREERRRMEEGGKKEDERRKERERERGRGEGGRKVVWLLCRSCAQRLCSGRVLESSCPGLKTVSPPSQIYLRNGQRGGGCEVQACGPTLALSRSFFFSVCKILISGKIRIDF
jgi:hypothetical protein